MQFVTSSEVVIERPSGGPSARTESIGRLVHHVEPIPSAMAVQRVAERFANDARLGALPVVDGDRPTGLVTRTKLSQKLFARFGMAIYERRPIEVLLDSPALVARAKDPVVAVLEQAIKRPSDDAYDDVIVVDEGGFYVGIVEVQRLVLEQGHVLARTSAARELADERAKELEAIAKMRSQFLAHVTHELRAPVNTLVGLAELVDSAAAANDHDKVRKYHGMIAKSSTSLRHLVNNVLDLSKIESGRMQPEPGIFVVDELLAEIAESLRVLARGKPLEIRVQNDGASVELVSDPVMARHVLTNLGTNAVKFTNEGSVTLRAAATIDGASIEVIDTGIGVDPRDLDRMFEPFTQAADVATRRQDGTGLGLAIVKQLVGLLGGSLEASSRLGHGSRFSVTLPHLINKETPL